MDTIKVHGILPIRAYNDIEQAPDEEETFSTHVPTWRGLGHAVSSARKLHRDYTQSHGNGAAHRIRITALGYTAHEKWWTSFVETMFDNAFGTATIQQYHRIDEAVRQEMLEQTP